MSEVFLFESINIILKKFLRDVSLIDIDDVLRLLRGFLIMIVGVENFNYMIINSLNLYCSLV